MAYNTALKLAIFSKGRTQKDVCTAAGMHESRLTKILRGYGPPVRPDEKAALARALRRRIDDLFPPEQASA